MDSYSKNKRPLLPFPRRWPLGPLALSCIAYSCKPASKEPRAEVLAAQASETCSAGNLPKQVGADHGNRNAFLDEIQGRAYALASFNRAEAEFLSGCYSGRVKDANCAKIKEQFSLVISQGLPRIRLNLALAKSAVATNSQFLHSTTKPNHLITTKIAHPVRGFAALTPLSQAEIKTAVDMLITQRNGIVEEFKTTRDYKHLMGLLIQSTKKVLKSGHTESAMAKELRHVRKFFRVEMERSKNQFVGQAMANQIRYSNKSVFQQNYYDLVGEYPFLGYLRSQYPTEAEIASAFDHVAKNAKSTMAALKAIKKNDAKKRHGLVVYSNIVETFLSEEPKYCDLAQSLKKEFDRRQLIKDIGKDLVLVTGVGACSSLVKSPKACMALGMTIKALFTIEYRARYNKAFLRLFSHVRPEHQLDRAFEQLDYARINEVINLLSIPAFAVGGLSPLGARAGHAVSRGRAFVGSLRGRDLLNVLVRRTNTTKSVSLFLEAPTTYPLRSVRRFVQWVPQYLSKKSIGVAMEFQPLAALGRALEKYALPSGWVFSPFLKSATTSSLGIAIFMAAFTGLESSESAKRENDAQQFLEHDFLFRRIKYQVEEQAMTADAARAEAASLLEAYHQYFNLVDKLKREKGLPVGAPELTEAILVDPILNQKFKFLFEDIGLYSKPSFWVSEDFEFHGERELTKERLAKLFSTTHEKLNVYGILDTDQALDGLDPKSLQGFASVYFGSPWYERLLQMQRSEKIDTRTFRWLAKALAYWLGNFEYWKILEVSPVEHEGGKRVILNMDKLFEEVVKRRIG